ncbi:unnamed protein product [Schistosoma mattheei]|uniref:Uncharacterized protein n=1 Tax=Schistosoma mattheei TaxID=31246 RepID=A0A183PN38_9TREM|nr:unnamed protein product [Schistosoma mattheei]
MKSDSTQTDDEANHINERYIISIKFCSKVQSTYFLKLKTTYS